MDRFDEMIGRALTEEDRALLASYDQKGYVAEALGVFKGPMGAVMWLVYAVVLVTFVGAVFALWQVATATDALTAVKWGVAGLVLMQMTALCKGFMGSHMEANRMLREIKRVELQVAMLRSARDP